MVKIQPTHHTAPPLGDDDDNELLLLQDGKSWKIGQVTTTESSSDNANAVEAAARGTRAAALNRTRRVKCLRAAFLATLLVLFAFSLGVLNVVLNLDSFDTLGDNATLTSLGIEFQDNGNAAASLAVNMKHALPGSLRLLVGKGQCDITMTVHHSPVDDLFVGSGRGGNEAQETMHFGTLESASVGRVAAFPDQTTEVDLSLSNTNPEAILRLRDMYSQNDTSDVDLDISCSVFVVVVSGYVIPLPWYVSLETVTIPASPYLLSQMPTEEDALPEDQQLITSSLVLNGLLPTLPSSQKPSSSSASNSTGLPPIEFSFPVPKSLRHLTLTLPDTVFLFWEALDLANPSFVDSMGYPSPAPGTPNVLAVGCPETSLTFIRHGAAVSVVELDVYAIKTAMPEDAAYGAYFMDLAMSGASQTPVWSGVSEEDEEPATQFEQGALTTVATWAGSFFGSDSEGAFVRSCSPETSILFYVFGLFRLERAVPEMSLFDNLSSRLQDILWNSNPYAPVAYDSVAEDEWVGEDGDRRRETLVDAVAPEPLINLAIFDDLTNVQEISVEITALAMTPGDDFILNVTAAVSRRSGVVFDLDLDVHFSDPTLQISVDFANDDVEFASFLPTEFESEWVIDWSEGTDTLDIVNITGDGTSLYMGTSHNFALAVDFVISSNSFVVEGTFDDVTMARTLNHDISGLIEWGTDMLNRDYVTVDHLYVRKLPGTYLFNVAWDHAYSYQDGDGNPVISAQFQENGVWFGITDVVFDFMSSGGVSLSLTVNAEVLPDIAVVVVATGSDPPVGQGVSITVSQMRVVIGSTTVVRVTEWNELIISSVEETSTTTVSVDFAVTSDIVGDIALNVDVSVIDNDIDVVADVNWSVIERVVVAVTASVFGGEEANLQAYFSVPFAISATDDTVRVSYSRLNIAYGGVNFIQSSGAMGIASGNDIVNILFDLDGDLQEYRSPRSNPWSMTSWFNIGAVGADFEVRCNYIRAGRNGDYLSGAYLHVPSAYLRKPTGVDKIFGSVELNNAYFYDLEGELEVNWASGSGSTVVTIPTLYLRQVHGSEFRYLVRMLESNILFQDTPSTWSIMMLAQTTGWDLSQTAYMYMLANGTSLDESATTLAAIGDAELTSTVNDGGVVIGSRAGISSSGDDICGCIAAGMTGGTCTPAGFPMIGETCAAGETSVGLASSWMDMAFVSNSSFFLMQNAFAVYVTDSDFVAVSKSVNSSGNAASASFFAVVALFIVHAFAGIFN